MKPNFALGLTDEGVTLWHRDAIGWLRVGSVALDTPNMDAPMRDMARIAAALAPEGVTTKLVIPDDQVLNCTLSVASNAPDEQEQEIRAQLVGRTPYPVEDLVFDWTQQGDIAQVVVVARETILEAEDFAQQYGLNPITAVAAANNAATPTEAYFGTTRTARKVVDNVALIERDDVPVLETGSVTLPDPVQIEPKSDTGGAVSTHLQSVTVPAHPADAISAPTVSKPTQENSKPASVSKTAASHEGHSDTEKTKSPSELIVPGQSPEPSVQALQDPAIQAAEDRQAGLVSKRNAADTASLVSSKIFANSKARFSQLLKGQNAPVETIKDSHTSDAKKAADAVSFRSRRGESVAPPAPASHRAQAQGLAAKLRHKASMAQAALTAALSRKPVAKAEDLKSSIAALSNVRDTAVGPLSAKTSAPNQSKASRASDTQNSTDSKTPELPKRKDPIETLKARSMQDRKPVTEAERMTIFGARNQQDTPSLQGNRALLILGGVGALLVAAAIWAAYFVSTQPSEGDFAEAFVPAATLEPEVRIVSESSPPLEDIEASFGLEDAAQQSPIEGTESGALDEDTLVQAATDMAVGMQETQAGRIAGLRSVALVPPQEAMPLPDAPTAPAPFGSEPLAPLRQEVDQVVAAGMAAEDRARPIDAPATALPDGEDLLEISVSEGTPAAVPPRRPDGLAPELEAVTEPETVQDSVVAIFPTDPVDESALAISVTQGSPAATPPDRPDAIAPNVQTPNDATVPTPSEADEAAPSPPEMIQQDQAPSVESDDAALSTPSLGGLALTALRPNARPEALVTQLAEIQPSEVPGLADASDLAVAASLRPGARPSQFAAVVERALRAQQPAASAPAQPTQSAPIQTARAAVPDTPAIPTSASVSREATQARAINLRQVNLLGVMGTSSSRRALVRLSNGRVVTVRVGETLDGGQVTAIADDELRYTRGGRNVVLRIAS
jgi:hypothetical protein